jgi:SNF2 family DNA or RNA helicase
VHKFQENPNTKLFLISIKSGGTGLNLTQADYVFILDPWWNPATEAQAVNRAHRIGQNKHVMVYRFITPKTVEEKIRKLQADKLRISDMFITSNNPLAQLSENEIEQLFE